MDKLSLILKIIKQIKLIFLFIQIQQIRLEFNLRLNFYTKIVDVSRIRTRIEGLDGYHANHLTTTTTTTKTTQTCKNFIEFLPR